MGKQGILTSDPLLGSHAHLIEQGGRVQDYMYVMTTKTFT